MQDISGSWQSYWVHRSIQSIFASACRFLFLCSPPQHVSVKHGGKALMSSLLISVPFVGCLLDLRKCFYLLPEKSIFLAHNVPFYTSQGPDKTNHTSTPLASRSETINPPPSSSPYNTMNGIGALRPVATIVISPLQPLHTNLPSRPCDSSLYV